MAVDLKPLNYLPWGARPKKTVQHNFGLAPFGPKIFGLKTFGAEKFGLAVPSRPAQCGACSWSIPTFCRYRESLIYPLRVTHLCSPTARCNVHNGSPSPGLIKFTTLGRPTAYSRYLYLLYVSTGTDWISGNIRVRIYPSTLTDQQMVTYQYLCCRKPTLNALWPWPSRM